MFRPDCIRHFREIQEPDTHTYPGSDELLGINANFGRRLGLSNLPGIHHVVLPPGRRTSRPHAESREDEFIYVIAGAPQVWLDGTLHPLGPGDGVAFPAGTGIAHAFINNTASDVQLLVVGECRPADNTIYYPCNPEMRATRADWWHDVPERPMGAHDGLPDVLRRK